MARYSLWLVGSGDNADTTPSHTPLDLRATTVAEAQSEAAEVWVSSVAPGVRVYENLSGRLVHELYPHFA